MTDRTLTPGTKEMPTSNSSNESDYERMARLIMDSKRPKTLLTSKPDVLAYLDELFSGDTTSLEVRTAEWRGVRQYITDLEQRGSHETREERYLTALQRIIMLSHEFNTERNAYAAKLEEIAHEAVTNASHPSAETRACAGCERGLPLDGYGHHYGRISNTGPLAPYYLDLTVCTAQKANSCAGDSNG